MRNETVCRHGESCLHWDYGLCFGDQADLWLCFVLEFIHGFRLVRGTEPFRRDESVRLIRGVF